MTDLVIIGGGATGMAAAVMLKRKKPNISIKILEKNDRVLKKVSVTGNGRCNITNKNLMPEHYHGSGKNLAFELLKNFDLKSQEAFFESIGLPIVYEDNKGFPMSKQANSVVDCLRFAAESLNIDIVTNCEVKKIEKNNDGFCVTTESKNFTAKAVLIACGSCAGGGKLGTDSGYSLLKNMGHKIVERRPSLVQVKTDKTFVTSLKGIKVDAKCRILVNGTILKTDNGEVLFCDYGLSGPPILQLSRIASFNKGAVISLDLFPKLSAEQLLEFLSKRATTILDRNCDEFFTGMLNKRLGQTILKTQGIDRNKKVSNLNKSEIKCIVDVLKNFVFITDGTLGMNNAQVAAGGADIKEFNKNLMSKKVNGLFAGGEVLDIDADCGGYNLMYCWASANTLCNSITEFLEKEYGCYS